MSAIEKPWAVLIAVVWIIAGGLFVAPAAADTERCEGTEVMRAGACQSPSDFEELRAVAQADPVEPAAPPEHTTTPAEPPPDDEDSPSAHMHRVAWVGFGAAAVGLATWAVTGSIALAKTESLKDDCPDDSCPEDREGDLDTARTLGNVATAGLVVGVIGTIWGVVALVVADEDGGEASEQGDETSASVRPVIGPGYLGLSGQF